MSDEITIRPLSTHEELSACVELQRETWGRSFTDAVPASILKVAQEVGGVASGAFDASDKLVGFVFGMSGVRDGNVVHWSDMLAVRPELQSRGVGRRLKEFQRAEVARIGAKAILWTYDPLVARNAHLNFNVFGVRVVNYVRDMYGETGSDLHRLGTDRLIVAWPVPDAELAERRAETRRARESREFVAAPVLGDAEHPSGDALTAQRLRIAVPYDIAAVQKRDASLAAQWRQANRAAFEDALRANFRVDGFVSDRNAERGYYLLSRGT